MPFRTGNRTGYHTLLCTPQQAVVRDSNGRDAFGRRRVSNPDTIFDDYHIYAKNDGTNGPLNWLYETSGGSETVAHDSDQSEINMTLTTVSGEYVYKQTRRYFPYIPGKSQLLMMTGILGAGEANCTKRVGLFDDEDGLYFSEIDGTYGVGIRTSTSGSAVDTVVNQSDWNVDPMDGNGPSGITVDFTKTQIFVIDLQWLGVGSVRYGISINGSIWPVHVTHNANQKESVYIKRASLPVRYEIKNTGTTTGNNTLTAICASLTSEGGKEPSGPIYTAGNGSTTRSISTRESVMAIKLADSYNSVDNRIAAIFQEAHFFSDNQDCYFEVVHVTSPTTVTGNFSAVLSNVSGVEVSTDVSVMTGGVQVKVMDAYVSGGSGNRSGPSISKALQAARNSFGVITQDFDSNASQYFVVFATSLSTATGVAASLTWQEVL